MKKNIFIIFTVIALIITVIVPTFAFSEGDLTDYLSPITDSEKLEYIRQAYSVSKMDNATIDGTIAHFDIDMNGAICCISASASQNTIIWVIEGNYCYAFTFIYSGSNNVCWFKGNLLISYNRSDYAVSYDKNGNILEAYIVSDPARIYRYTKKIVNGNTYYLDRTTGELLFSDGYGRLQKKDEAGNVTTIYDVKEVKPIQLSWVKIGIWSILILQMCCGISILIKYIIKKRKRKQSAK